MIAIGVKFRNKSQILKLLKTTLYLSTRPVLKKTEFLYGTLTVDENRCLFHYDANQWKL